MRLLQFLALLGIHTQHYYLHQHVQFNVSIIRVHKMFSGYTHQLCEDQTLIYIYAVCVVVVYSHWMKERMYDSSISGVRRFYILTKFLGQSPFQQNFVSCIFSSVVWLTIT